MLQKVIITLSVFLSFGLIWLALSFDNGGQANVSGNIDAVREENGVQYIRVLARGGYTPNQINAKANMPTVLEIETQGTYDCTAGVVIPELDYQEFLPATGVTEIEIPENLAINSLNLLCSMGMYSATVEFSS